MGGFSDLTKRLAAMQGQAVRTTESLGEVPAAAALATSAAEDGAKAVEAATVAMRRSGFFGGISARPGDTASDGPRITGNAGGDDGQIGPRFTQQEIIDTIRNTTVSKSGSGSFDVGKYLDKYIELYMDLLIKGASQTLTPQRQRQIEEALYKRDIGAQDIIRRYAGSAGRKINFAQLEADIKKMVALQQEMARAARRAGQAPRTSGTLGSATTTSTPASSLAMLLQSGALR